MANEGCAVVTDLPFLGFLVVVFVRVRVFNRYNNSSGGCESSGKARDDGKKGRKKRAK